MDASNSSNASSPAHLLPESSSAVTPASPAPYTPSPPSSPFALVLNVSQRLKAISVDTGNLTQPAASPPVVARPTSTAHSRSAAPSLPSSPIRPLPEPNVKTKSRSGIRNAGCSSKPEPIVMLPTGSEAALARWKKHPARNFTPHPLLYNPAFPARFSRTSWSILKNAGPGSPSVAYVKRQREKKKEREFMKRRKRRLERVDSKGESGQEEADSQEVTSIRAAMLESGWTVAPS
ncbi:hypothetical protein RTBOTA2_006737 [Rhodotorula toruloides]|uniref:Uncharacterized protein n=1 Tax=Rhodotorula toruloides TaxID=5286 RepID=A0A2T0ACI5_RHOTO|nr:hypothetical protein RTBOTA2_006737 [Rhodotorula toruloides]PRQ75684.1 hypothetical protein AAT19DRAFT_13741 [Rhodotorula toruloides]